MCTKEQIQKAKEYLSNKGYGTGTNFTVNTVANLMAEWEAKNANKINEDVLTKAFKNGYRSAINNLNSAYLRIFEQMFESNT